MCHVKLTILIYYYCYVFYFQLICVVMPATDTLYGRRRSQYALCLRFLQWKYGGSITITVKCRAFCHGTISRELFSAKGLMSYYYETHSLSPKIYGWTRLNLRDKQHLIGPVEIPAWLNGDNYLEFLENLHNLDYFDDISLETLRTHWIQHDGAPAHFARRVRQYLNVHFAGCCVGLDAAVKLLRGPPDLRT